MESIREIYRIGHGPSSSHTMGPSHAATLFKQRNPQAARFVVTLYGSLAATGKGHLTDKAIIEASAPIPVDIVWKPEEVLPFHPNGMHYQALDQQGRELDQWTVYSIGGGALSEGATQQEVRTIYPHHLMKDILQFIEEQGLTFWEYVERYEDHDVWDFLSKVWIRMQLTIQEGIAAEGVLPGQLHLRSKAHQAYVRASSFKSTLQGRYLVSAYALATSEQNARGGIIVTAPTCGSSGVLPAVLYHLQRSQQFSNQDILRALATAGLFADVIKANASISGAEVGCQGEVGSACVMAAAAVTQLFGGTPQQIECAGEMAMEHNLGLTCDPMCGLVQIPCIERNVMAALRSLDINTYAMMGDGKHIVSFDKVVATMNLTGKDLPSLYKETSKGGLAVDNG